MIVVIGEILVDMFPDYERIGGAPFNFAYHLKKLGFAVRFLTRLGDDRQGRRIIDILEKNDFDLADVQIDSRWPTGTVRVELDQRGVPRFEIRENVAYDHLDLGNCKQPGSGDPALIYFGSLLQRTDAGLRQVQHFLSCSGNRAACFCDINLRPPHINDQAVRQSLHHADLLKLNDAELAAIQQTFNGPDAESDCIAWLMDSFGINTVALTRGSRGSTCFSNNTRVDIAAETAVAITDTVGAGDAYASILAAGYMRQIPWAKTLGHASRFAATICGTAGAVPEDSAVYDDLRTELKGMPDA